MFKKIILILQIISYVVYVCAKNDLFAKFHQHDYKLRDLRSEVAYLNKDCMHAANLKAHKFNRTTIAFNFTMWPKIDFGDKVEVVVQAFKRASNEYRLFPMRFQINMCKTFESNMAGLKSIGKYGNFTTCFWKKDVLYYANNVFMDDSLMPPYLPHGEYKMQNELMYDNIKLVTINAYVEVYSSSSIKRK